MDQIGTGKGATLYINTLVKIGEKWVFYPRLLTQNLSLKGRLNPEFLLSHLLHKAHPTEHSPRSSRGQEWLEELQGILYMRSQFPLHRLLETQFTACRNDGQVVVHVVADQVTDTLKTVILSPNLRIENITRWSQRPQHPTPQLHHSF